MPKRPNNLRSTCILIFGTAHLVYLAASVLPLNWRNHGLLGHLIAGYESATTSVQNWGLFDTIPTVHSLDAHLRVEVPGQEPERVGMVLPGLRLYPQPENTRFYGWMHMTILSTQRSDQREPYMKHAAAELLATGKYPPDTQISLVVDTEYTRNLAGVRTLREIAAPKHTAMGPFRLSDLAQAPSAAR
jgi:hypothetical protein